MQKLRIAVSFFTHTPIRYWARNFCYFAGLLLWKALRIRRSSQKVLYFGEMKVAGDSEGGSGLVFLHEVCVRRTYESVRNPPNIEIRMLFDVGANSGFVALSQCQEHPILSAVCFEPHPKTFSILQKNIALNQLNSRIRSVHAAVGAHSGTCYLRIREDSSMGTVEPMPQIESPNRNSVQVPLIALDDFSRQHGIWPDLIKIDVEGFELEVLRGATECLRRAKRVILEYHSPLLKEQSESLLCGTGYLCRVHGSLIFADAREPESRCPAAGRLPA